MDLQCALLAVRPAITSKPAPAPKQPKPVKAGPRRLAVGSFDCPASDRKRFDTTGVVDRPSPSRPPAPGIKSNWPSPVGAAARHGSSTDPDDE